MRGSGSHTITIEEIHLNVNPLADENGLDSDEQSQLALEQALQAINFHENEGFILKYERTCYPDLSTPPRITGIGSESSETPSPWALTGPSHFGTICLKHGEKELLNFRYHSQYCLTFWKANDRISNVYVPQLPQTIGKIQCGAFGHGGTITDFVSKSIFLMSQVASEPAPRIHISDDIGNIISVAEGFRSLRRRGGTTWTDFKFTYSLPASNSLPASTKLMLAVGFIMWVFIYQEKKAGDRWAVIWLAITVVIIFASIWPILRLIDYL
ncbi:unnamed protein product [Orchesella dallaii]|uniref:Uncharacterized protein n=1 Tax=Orchesella dallaii TaxID=48710 RepID=A0ABP1S0U8_9HEXA